MTEQSSGAKVVELITSGACDSAFHDIHVALVARQRLLLDQKSYQVLGTLGPGDRVEFTSAKDSLRGVKGTVLRLKLKKVEVKIDTDVRAGRWSGKVCVCPASMLTKVITAK